MDMTELETLKAEHDRVLPVAKSHSDRLRALSDEIERLEGTAKRQENVGRFFKYRNSRSCPSEESDYWWIYIHVVGLDAHAKYLATEFQTIPTYSSDTQIEINGPAMVHDFLIDGGVPIARDEYDKALAELISDIRRRLNNITSLVWVK